MNEHAEALQSQLHTFRPDMVEHVKLLIAALEKFDGKIQNVQGKEKRDEN